MATVYTVASAKGGVGKTTTAAAIATLLADAGASVVVIDADLGMANLAGALGIDVEGETVHDVLAGRAEPEAAVQEGPRGLRVLPGETDLDAYADADPAGLADVVAAFGDADYVILDAGAGLSHDSALPLGIADRTLLVSTPEREALRDTAKTGELADRLGGTVDGAVITRVDPDDPHGHDDLIVSHLDVPIHERIPEDDAVGAAVAAGDPLAVFAPTAPATRVYRSLTERLTDVDLPEPEPTAADDDGTDGVGSVVDGVETDAAADDGDVSDAEPEPTAAAGTTADVEMTVGDLTESGEEETDEPDATETGTEETDVDRTDRTDAPAIRDAEDEVRDAEDEGASGRTGDGTSIEHDEIEGIAEATGSEGSAESSEAAQPAADEESGTDERAATDDAERTETDADEEKSDDGSEATDDPTGSGVESVPFREGVEAESTSEGSARRPEQDGENDAASGGGRDDIGSGRDDIGSGRDGVSDVSERDGESANGDREMDEGDESDERGFFSRLFGR